MEWVKSKVHLRISNEDLDDSRSSRKSSELRLPWSKLVLIELEELLRLCLLASLGSTGVKPALLANILRISVKDTTPINLPLRCAPGRAPAVRVGGAVIGKEEEEGSGESTDIGGTATAGGMVGVGGAVDAGLGVSTIHILQVDSMSEQHRVSVFLEGPTHLCACVATILATVCARVDWAFTWNTGYESLPSLNPLSVKITDKKCKQEDFNRGIELDLVRYCKKRFSFKIVEWKPSANDTNEGISLL